MPADIQKICIYIGQLYFGGAEKQSIFLAEALNEHYRVEFIVFKGNRVEDDYRKLLDKINVSYHFLKGSFPARLIRLHSLFRKAKYDLIFCYLPGDQVIGTILGRFAGIKYIAGGIRNTKIVRKKFIFMKGIQNRLQDAIIFNSRKAQEIYCNKGYKRSKSLVIDNTIMSDLNYPERRSSGVIRILMVGRFVAQKDYETGIRAIAHLRYTLKVNNLKLIIAGFGEQEPSIREWLNKYKVGDITEMLIKPDNLPDFYRSCDMMINSSIYEGMSNSIMEGTAYGLPVVATETGDIDKLVKNGESGFIVPVGDHVAIAEKLNILCQNKEQREQFGREAFKNIRDNYSFDRFKEKYISFIESLT